MEFWAVCMLRKGLAGRVASGESSFEETSRVGSRRDGVTYKALDVDLRCPMTLKVISERYLGDESARLRFLREARAAASVWHPNVAWVLHLCRTGQNYFYAMEFVEGMTL
jgi:serine/threonine-protein kinase